MAQPCSVCTHADAVLINAALVARQPYRHIAKRFGVSLAALSRHAKNCMPAIIDAGLDAMDERERRETAEALDTVRQLRTINSVSLSILSEARDAGEPDTALRAIDRIQKQIELQAKLIGDLQQEGTTSILISAEWLELRAVIVTALEPYSDARGAVLRAIEGTSNRRA